VLGHRPPPLRGRSLGEVMRTEDRTPDRLLRCYATWTEDPTAIRRTRPALAFAVVGQARARGLLTPEGEDRLLGRLISYWALDSTLQANARSAALPAGWYKPEPHGIAEGLPRPLASQPRARLRTRAVRIPEYRP